MGDAINTASRVEQMARPGTVLISEDTYQRVASDFNVEAEHTVVLKGRDTPTTLYRIVSSRAYRTRMVCCVENDGFCTPAWQR